MTLRDHLVKLRCRYAPGQTQAEISRQLGLTRGSVNGWERGHSIPARDHLQALLDLYGASDTDRLDAWRLASASDTDARTGA